MIFNLTKTEKEKAQITIYGPIQDFSSFFSSTGYSPDKLMRDLDELANAKELTIRINSGGGSAFAGFAIFELIRAHGAKVTTYIDGVAASAASIIAMAGDRIVMGTGAMMMVHNPWTRVEGEAKDLREAADVLDRVGESLINVYSARTGKSRDELRDMLNKTTWMTAEEAVSFGFANEIDNKFAVSASIQGEQVVFNDQRFAFSCFAEVPRLPVVAAVPQAIQASDQQDGEPVAYQAKEDEEVKDLEELKAKYPDIYQAAVKDGQEQERTRLKALDAINAPGNSEFIAKAKYEAPITAAEAALQILELQNARRKNHAAAAKSDSDESGIDEVKPEDPEDNKTTESEQITQNAKSVADFMNKKRGGK